MLWRRRRKREVLGEAMKQELEPCAQLEKFDKVAKEISSSIAMNSSIF